MTMPRFWKAALIVVAVAVIAGLAWLASTTSFELRVVDSDEPPVEIEIIPPTQQRSPVVEGVLRAMGLGFMAVLAAAVVYTAWAVAKQILLIRRGRPDSR